MNMTEISADIGTLLGKGAGFTGKLAFQGTVRIEGTFEGEILSDDTLVVAKGGEIRGTVRVGHLIVTGGLVEADVVAIHSVEILPGGIVTGRVTTPSLQIEKGALFQGQSNMPLESGHAGNETP